MNNLMNYETSRINGFDLWPNELKNVVSGEPRVVRPGVKYDSQLRPVKNTVKPGGVGQKEYKEALTNNVEELMRKAEPIPVWLWVSGGAIIVSLVAAATREILSNF